MAGHSKWAQIKHRKALTDSKRGRLFSKLSREITLAAKTADTNPELNARLRTAMDRAKNAGMPKDNIERAIERATKSGAGENLFEVLYEASAPGGIAIIIEGITDNKNRTHSELKHLLQEHGARMAAPGSLLWNFEKIGVLELNQAPQQAKEECELAIIDAGARDFSFEDGAWVVETNFLDQETAREALKRAGLDVTKISHDYKAKNYINVPSQEKETLLKLLDALLEHDDVQEVYTNIMNL